MANPLTSGSGVTSGAGENSSSQPQTYAAQQQAILDAAHAAEKADAARVNAANRSATRAPSQQTMSNTLDDGDFGIPFTVTPAATTPKPRRAGRKGK